MSRPAENIKKEVIISLLSNKDFRDWVLDPTPDRELYWQKWIGGDEEKQALVQQARTAILGIKFKEEFLEENQLQEILGAVVSHQQLGEKAYGVNPGKNIAQRWLAIAATFVLLAAAAFLFYERDALRQDEDSQLVEMHKAENPAGRKSKFMLPDGSIVFLNSNSALMFPVSFSSKNRVVELMGEGYFEVKKDPSRPFVVKAGGIATKVIGTSFNVRAFEAESEIEISLVSGKVEVSGETVENGLQRYLLEPGERISYSKQQNKYQKGLFNIVDVTGWKDGILVFRDTNFKDFIHTLENWYGVKITVAEYPSKMWRVNGEFNNESLEEVLMGVQFTYDIDYKINEKEVTIKCN